MKVATIVSSLFIYHSFLPALVYGLSDGLSGEFLKKAAKAAAVSGLSAHDEDYRIAEYLKQFSGDSTVWKLYTEQGPEGGRDDAAFVDDDGQCFVAFQSTKIAFDDWMQNANMLSETLCNKAGECCTFRDGFTNGWTTQWQESMINDVKNCVAKCTKDPCLVVAGHSQGGAIATVASLQLADYTPSYEVITFAAPPALTVHPNDCYPQMNFNAHYRFGKVVYKNNPFGGLSGLLFDKVSFLGPDPLPGLSSFSVGEFLILSTEDTENVAYAGFNTELVLRPWDNSPPPLGSVHNLWNDSDNERGYFQLMRDIAAQDSSVGISGYELGMHCGNSDNGPLLCISDRCDRANGELHATCKEKLANGEPCNADTDCLSGRCPSKFPSKCEDKAGPDEKCANNEDCIDGYYCPFGLNRKCREKTDEFSVLESGSKCDEETSATVPRFNNMMNSIPYLLVAAYPYLLE